MFDKQIFKISLNAQEYIPSHENLYEYTLPEHQQVSDYLAKNYPENPDDPICKKFINFRDSGLTADGSDNGVDMNDSNHPNKKSLSDWWARTYCIKWKFLSRMW